MEQLVQVAYCAILFQAKGGTFTPSGRPIFVPGVAALCDDPHDCGGCAYLQNWAAHLMAEGWGIGWECDACLRLTEDLDRGAGIERHVQGYYQQGGKHPWASEDEEAPPLPGCTRCGWASIVLQLVLRRMP
jgi:hypothetical protein